ncbi:class I adenylate-forming enzyme family protein [Agromyces bauzanensis]|uniref:AMP-binding protein n=1 Tax=Agromyces bauzanensis TaxID=1308924 RepID=A0A917PT42_9MICO|nr:class I adenylate-forming enzyme family protein [Agromyces bauzanensis]GGJ90957.1 AMP-binding protein [Agromyces bauzanensis]
MYQEARGQTVNKMYDYSCEQWGSREAVVYGDERLTYSQLRRRVATLATGLSSIGVRKGDRVAFLLGVTPDWVTTFYAAMRIGAVAVPLNLGWTGREIVRGLELTEANVLVATDDFRKNNYLEMLTEQIPTLASQTKDALKIEELPSLRTVISLSESNAKYQFAHDFREVQAAGADYVPSEFEQLHAQVRPDDFSIMLLTSGTTSFPKPVLHNNETLLVGAAGYADGIEAVPDDKMLIVAPNYHVAGYLTMLMPHMRGGSIHLLEYYLPHAALEVIERERITMMFGFDVHFLMMARHPKFGMYDISSMTRTMIGSAPGSYDEIKAMGITHQGNIYGSSEYVASQGYFPFRDRKDEYHMRLSHGRPMLGTDIVVKDPTTGKTLAPDEPGELCFKGPALFKGYYNMPEETAAAFDEEGYFHSGDYGWIDAEGYIFYRGRYKETIKSGGENVSAQEVELFLELDTPWVLKAMVVGLPDPRWGEAVTALVELRPGMNVSGDEIRNFCRDKLAGYKIPKQVVFVENDDWVTTPTGKYDRGAMTDFARLKLEAVKL